MSKPTSILFSILWLFQLLFPSYMEAQNLTVESIALLPLETDQSSGLILLNDKLITHNDSAGEPALYEVDPNDGTLIRKIIVENSSNVDWEDICLDLQYIYIGDFGNNRGDRTDLKIYRVSLEEYLQSSNDTVSADTIQFSYSDQMSFEPGNQHNFDAEGLISFEDSLYIFTKNRGDFHTNIYSVPKAPGDYQVRQVGSINSLGLISGAVYNLLSNEIVLTGYTAIEPFLLRISNFTGNDFTSGQMDRLTYQVQGSYQIEAIEAINNRDYYISSETNTLGEATLLRVNTDFVVGINDYSLPELQLYPNPVSNSLRINLDQYPEQLTIALVNFMGQHVLKITYDKLRNETIEFDLTGLPSGNYVMHLTAPTWQATRKLVITQTEF